MANKKNITGKNFINPGESDSALFGIKKENNFLVPENYFDELPQRIQEKIIRNKKQYLVYNFQSYFTKPIWMATFAVFIGIIAVGVIMIFNQNAANDNFAYEISFEFIMQEYPDIIEYMDDEALIQFATAELNEQKMEFIDMDLGYDSIQLEDEWIQSLSDEEITEILNN